MFPTNNLHQYFEELEDKNWTLIPIDLATAQKLAKSAQSKKLNNELRAANITQSQTPLNEVRNDRILWLDAKTVAPESIEALALTQLHQLVLQLKDYFRTSLNEYECHYAHYPKGHFYQKHRDSTQTNNKRFFSFVIYLNENWTESCGGELVGYDQKQNIIFKILPQIGNMMLFKSEIEHEVLPTQSDRYSLTGWIRK